MTEKQHRSRCDKDEKFVRHAGDKSTFPFICALRCARKGIMYAFATQKNLKVHICFAIAAILLGFLLSVSEAGWLAIVLCIAIVMSLEVLNTAIESVVDMVSPEWNALAMRAKDCAAGAVYIAAIGSLIVAAIVYIPRIIYIVGTFISG
ncbi:diacylglycerol kinase [Adlercreutzia sp. ZJ154]|uniref:diacylglycerol kinase n=1 Tax=Adlercreutzia sp. ZJ154 TaxID=2709790 RepID=UPI0013ED98E5|nr:diacylglycerol kinase family protein [Adlercreutzia sp. ZJ154]